MKYILILAVLFSPSLVYGSTQNVHHDFNEPYDCSITGSPQKINWIKKGDKSGNKQIKLKWFDSKDAHDVEIDIIGKDIRVVPDDGTQVIKKLKKNKNYQIRMRGISNCGEGEWTRYYKFKS